MEKLKIEVNKKEYKGWPNCISLSNGLIEAIVTTDVGPRIIYFGFAGSHNEFYENEEQVGTTGGDEWKIYGGHRLWHSPEVMPRTYSPDNTKIKWKKIKNGIRVTQPVEAITGLAKEMDITMSPDNAKMTIIHRIENMGQWDIEFAAWALTVMAAGGREIIPEIEDDTGLLPNRSLTLWPYTKMNDSRIKWGDSYIMLDQDSSIKTPVKLGLPVSAGWAAYANRGHLFVKKFDHCCCCEYPDNGCSYETYTCSFMLEMESLSPLNTLSNGDIVEHFEEWYLFKDVKKPENEKDIINDIIPLIEL